MAKIRKTKKKRPIIYAFIDSQNLNLGVLSQGWKLDFARFRVYLKEKYQVEKAFLFIGYVPQERGIPSGRNPLVVPLS